MIYTTLALPGDLHAVFYVGAQLISVDRSTETEKAKAKERIQGLNRSKRVADRKVRRAKHDKRAPHYLQAPHLRFEEPEWRPRERREDASQRRRRYGARGPMETTTLEPGTDDDTDADKFRDDGPAYVTESELQAALARDRSEIRQEVESEERARNAAES